MARLIAVFVLLLMLAPATMAEPARQALADHDWVGGLWHRFTAWISGIGACLIPEGLQAGPGGDTARVEAEPGGARIGACIIPEG